MHFSMSKTFKILKYEIRSDGMKTILFSDKDFKSLKELKNFRKEFAKPVLGRVYSQSLRAIKIGHYHE